MCEPITMALMSAASTAMSVIGTLQQGQQQKDYANYQAAQAQADAKAERDAAEIHANKIRKAARLQAGQARAAFAGSGVDVGEGSAVTIESQIYGDAEEDALTTILSGADAAKRGQATAEGFRIRGQQAQTNSYFNAAGTALSGGVKIAKGWKGVP